MNSSSPTLSTRAFGEHADPRLVIAYSEHLAARQHLDSTLNHESGSALLYGPAGSGKTTTIKEHAAWTARDTAVAVVNGSGLTPRHLVDNMLEQFGVEHSQFSDDLVLGALGRFLGDWTRKKPAPVLYVDNFDRTSASTRRLLNWFAALDEHNRYSLRFVLSATEDLSLLFSDQGLRDLSQRLQATWTMNPLSRQETAMYLRTKWICAGGGDSIDEVFTPDVCASLHMASKGWPGSLNDLASIETAHDAEQEAAIPSVVLTRDGETLNRYPLPPRNYVIGRSELADIRVDDRFVSNIHALLQVYRNAIVLFDLNSTNGTTVNSIEIKNKILRNNDVIMLGHHRLKIEDAPPYSAEVDEQIDVAETQVLQNLDKIRQVRARHNIAALKHK